MRDEHADRQLDAERAVIGSLLIDEDITRELLSTVRADDFINATNRQIYLEAKNLLREGRPVDPITVRARIGEQYSSYLLQLLEITPTSANWKEYAAIMREQATVSKVRSLADKLGQAVTMEDCRTAIADLQQLAAGRQAMKTWTLREGLDEFFEAQDEDAPAPKYIKTGLDFLDNAIFLDRGSVMAIAGEPSSGKTALGLQIAYHMAASYNVGFFSLETDRKKIRDRLIAGSQGIELRDIKLRLLKDPDWQHIAQNQQDYVGRNLLTLEASGCGADEIESTALAMGFDVIFIDYAQLISPYDRRAPRSEQMREVSQSLHTFAQDHGIMVVELAQLTRPPKDQKGSVWEPKMSDIKESGQFEQDADLILVLWDPNPADDPQKFDYNRILKVAKNKEGPRGRWPLDFNGKVQHFELHPVDSMSQNPYITAGKVAKAQRRASAHDPAQMQILTDDQSRDEIDAVFPADQGGSDAEH